MNKFIEVHDTIINVDDIRKVEFLGDDIYLGLFPMSKDGQVLCDFIPFDFAKIHTFDGKTISVSIDLYPLEDEETENDWICKNRSYIDMTMQQLTEILNPIVLTDKEYS